ncbi:hypothetical protein QI274_13035, partial [Staphylococcus saprophyticus]|nr:hypothetical protein [Staphylococcus saprophyticus]
TNNLDNLIAIKETSKYSVKSLDFLTDDDEKKSTLVLLKFLFLEIAYIYLAHICVLRAYICF